jgi:hypothetical protein
MKNSDYGFMTGGLILKLLGFTCPMLHTIIITLPLKGYIVEIMG